jgi:hypothetical protein
MTKKVQAYKKGGKVSKSKRKAPPKRSKLPTLGGSLTGLGGTGASGMIP